MGGFPFSLKHFYAQHKASEKKDHK